MGVHGASSPWRRFGIRLIAVVVLGVLVGAGWLAVIPSSARRLTIYGRPIVNAGQLLTSVQDDLDQQVRARHGVRSRAARCYYSADSARPFDLPAGIGDQLFCGPVLFVGGSPDRPYLSYRLVCTLEPGGGYRLAVSSSGGAMPSADPRPALRLLRPDGAVPPARTVLPPPEPPAAVGDVLTTTSTVATRLTAAGAAAVMVGRLTGARLVEYGFVGSYGVGDQARTAPVGYRLLAFAAVGMPGEEGVPGEEAVPGMGGAQQPDLSVRVDGVERGPLAPTSDYVVIAVPARASQVELVLTDSGIKQAVSLLTGRPAATNPPVTRRVNRIVQLDTSRPVRVRLTSAAGAGVAGGTLSIRSVSLSYWSPDGSPCPDPDRAWLHVQAMVRLDGDPRAYGAEPALLAVSIPVQGSGSGSSSVKLPARNAAADPAREVDDVVEVPASLTAGTIFYAGTVKTANGTMTVLTPVTVAFDFPAG